MKNYFVVLTVIVLLSIGILFASVSKNTVETAFSEPVITLTGKFQGLSDPHSVEVLVNGYPMVYQFYGDTLLDSFQEMNRGDTITFDVEADAEYGVEYIINLHEKFNKK